MPMVFDDVFVFCHIVSLKLGAVPGIKKKEHEHCRKALKFFMIVVKLSLSWSSYIHIFDIVVCAPLNSKELVILCTRHAFKRVGHSVHSVCL